MYITALETGETEKDQMISIRDGRVEKRKDSERGKQEDREAAKKQKSTESSYSDARNGDHQW